MKRSLPVILFTIVLVAALAGSDDVLARPLSQGGAPTVVSYQGQVRIGGQPYSGTGYFKFAVVDTGGSTTYWNNDGTASGEPVRAVQLPVTNGLFSVLLGDTSLGGMTQPLAASVFSGQGRYLRVWFSTAAAGPFQRLAPDARIAAVPYALQADQAIYALQAQQAADADALDGHDGAYLQKRVANPCPAGSSIRAIEADGTVVCEEDDNTTYTAGTGLTLSGNQLSVNTPYRLPQTDERALRLGCLQQRFLSVCLQQYYQGAWRQRGEPRH